jgi:integrase/recombinase XerD
MQKNKPYRYVQRMLDRYGVWRHYLRRPGFKRAPLAGLYGSDEFAESYRLAMTGGTMPAPPRAIGAGRAAAGSLAHLIGTYKGSTNWTRLAVNSVRNRRPMLEKLRTGDWASVPVPDFGPKHVRRILDGFDAPHSKKHMLKTLRGLFDYAIEQELIEVDPSAGIKVKAPKTDGYWSWLADEIAQFRDYWPLGSEPRLVLEFALETASRRCEVARLGRQHLRGGRIQIKRAKGCNAVDIVVTPELKAAIGAMPACNRLTYLAGPGDKPYTPEQLGSKFAEWADEAGLPKRCRLHGLRKARTNELASLGISTHGIMAVTGHKSIQEVQRYTEKFKRLQAGDEAMATLLSRTKPARSRVKLAGPV